jgi:cytochrome c oxidase assembly factor 1
MPIFIILITISALGIFNYQKSSSSIVASTLYALRTSELGKRELGEEIYFRDMWPWIWGEMNQLHGRVDIKFGVKGTTGRGVMRFKSERRGRMGKVSRVSTPGL